MIPTAKKKAVFLDRDGTLIEDLGYNADPEKIFPLKAVFHGLKKIAGAGYILVVITNQSGVGRGFFSMNKMDATNCAMVKIFLENGIALGGVYSCPHSPEDDCGCRKPATGLIMKAAEELGIEIANSVVIGDKLSDVSAGIAAGTKLNILLSDSGRAGDGYYVAKDLEEAAELVLNMPEDFKIRRYTL